MKINLKKRNKRILNGFAYFFCALFLLGGLCDRSGTKIPDQMVLDLRAIKIDETATKKDLKFFTRYPHPFGSNRQKEIREYLFNQLDDSLFKIYEQPFEVEVPNIKILTKNTMASRTVRVKGANVLALPKKHTRDCLVLMASHYDSKNLLGEKGLGANDSGSSSVALIHLAKQKSIFRHGNCEVGFVWFDGEESVLENWKDGENLHPAKIQDNTYGSRHLAKSLVNCGRGYLCLPKDFGSNRLTALVLLDMIGSKNIKISRDNHSNKSMLESALQLAELLGQRNLFSDSTKSIEDDHIPFLKRGIPSLNLIDFEHTQHWHRPSDTFEKISINSIHIASTLGLAVALQTPEDIKDITP